MGQVPDLKDSYRHSPTVLWREVGDETILLDVERGTYFTLNVTGRRIWALLDDAECLAVVLEQLKAEFESPEEDLAADLLLLVSRLAAAKLISRRIVLP